MNLLKIKSAVFRLLTISLVTMLFISNAVYASNEMTLTVPDVSAKPGETVEIPIQLTNNSGVAGMMFSVTYDSDLILDSITRGDALSGLDFTVSGDLKANPVNVMFDGLDADATAGTVAVLNFTVSSKAKGDLDIKLSYTKGNIFDNDLNDVDVNIVDGSINVISSATQNEGYTDSSTVVVPDKSEDTIIEEPVKEDNEGEINSAKLNFNDVSEKDWYYGAVEYAVSNKLFNGINENEFGPDNLLTRAMLVTVLWRADGEADIKTEGMFDDVEPGTYYEKAVMWAKTNGIVTGISETEFAPDSYITREQIAAIIYRYAVYKGYDVTTENTSISSYDDYADISGYAIEAMQYACASGLIKGKTDTTINPKDNATRAETATILQRFIENN